LLPGLVLASSCSLLGGDPSPEGAVDDLAEALSKRNLDGVELVEAPKESADQLAAAIAALKDYPVTVTADDAEAEDTSATATLHWAWDLPGDDWEYDAPVELLLDGDTWRVDWAATIVEPSLKAGEVLDTTNLLPRRGDIVGADGRPLVTYRPVVRFGIDKTQVSDTQTAGSARQLAEVLDIDAAAYVERVKKAGPKAFIEALVLREQEAKAVTGLGQIPGAAAIGTEIPLGPTREFAAPILGTVGGHWTVEAGVRPDRSSASELTILNVEPGGYCPKVAVL
jgi:hypothetical protein